MRSIGGRPWVPSVGGWAATVALIIGLAGCGPTYSKSVEDVRTEIADGEVEAGIEAINKELEVEAAHELPEQLEGRETLLLLERATLLQALGEHDLAARDMMIADQRLGWLDIDAHGKVPLGKYLYSGSSVRYRAPPYERLMLNTLNMINFLALGRWEGARVEARRFSLLQYFYLEKKNRTLLPGAVAFGNYLGGVAFEVSGDYREAADRYLVAWTRGIQRRRLRRRIATLCSMIGRKPSELVDDRFADDVRGLDGLAKKIETPTYEAYRESFVDGELLAVIQTGMVPYKETRRYSVAQAVQYAAERISGGLFGQSDSSNGEDEQEDFGEGQTNIAVDAAAVAGGTALSLSSERHDALKELAATGAVESLNFPVLTEDGLPGDREVSLALDGKDRALQMGVDVEKQVRHGWKRVAPKLMVAALSRLAARAIAGAAARGGLQAATETEGDDGTSDACEQATSRRSRHCMGGGFEGRQCTEAYEDVQDECGRIEACWQAQQRKAACCSEVGGASGCCGDARDDVEEYCGGGDSRERTSEIDATGDSEISDRTKKKIARKVGTAAIVGAERAAAKASNPDTRSWSLLPGRIRLRRLDVEPGTRELQVRVDGRSDTKSVDVADEGPTVVNFSRYR